MNSVFEKLQNSIADNKLDSDGIKNVDFAKIKMGKNALSKKEQEYLDRYPRHVRRVVLNAHIEKEWKALRPLVLSALKDLDVLIQSQKIAGGSTKATRKAFILDALMDEESEARQ